MATNITDQRYSDDDLQLAEPHFDEEATMLSARPVIPLDEITESKTAAGSRKRLAFGLSLVASLIVGILGATLVLRQRGQKAAAEIVETAIAGTGASADDSALPLYTTGELKVDKAPQAVVVSPKAKTADAAIARQDSQVARKIETNEVAAEPETIVSPAEEREIRRAERIEARRLRRQAAREERWGRGRGRRHADDLLRIPEIFEGRRRP